MSRQSLIDNFFKCKASPIPKKSEIDSKIIKRNLSLVKSLTPSETSKTGDENRELSDIITLSSDDEDIWETPIRRTPRVKMECSNDSEEPLSESSTSTLPYSPTKSFNSPTTPKKQIPKHTPKKEAKFFSPIKKRSIALRPVKRSLTNEMSKTLSSSSRIVYEDELFVNACEGMDDKTIFLLETINKYLQTPSLRHLLDTQCDTLLSKCLEVVKPGMKLVCRLYWRKEGWFKKDQLMQICSDANESIEEDNFQNIMTSLMENGLVEQNSNITFDQFTSILKMEELKDICKELKLKVNSKQEAIEALKKFSERSSNISNFLTGYTSSNSKRVLNMMSMKVGNCYKLSDLARNTLSKLYIIMYIGMDYNIIREKKLELTLIYDKIKRETYPIDKSMELDNASIIFKTKNDFDRYITAHNIYEDFVSCTDVETKCNIVKHVYRLYKDIGAEEMHTYTQLPEWLQRFTPASKYVKILESGIQELKKDKNGSHYLLALEILNSLLQQNTFRQHRKAEWFAEKALILHNCLSRSNEAAEVLLEGFRSCLSEELKDSLRPRAKKIAHQKNISLNDELKLELQAWADKETIQENNFPNKHIEKLPMERANNRGKVKFETRTSEGRLVQGAEEFCIGHYLYSKEFTDGEHWEGRIVTSLFFLLFWKIIYSKPPGARGVFLSYYQQYPLDLFTDSFYDNRKEAIDDWLITIESASEERVLEIMYNTWSGRPEYELSGFTRLISWENLRDVAVCLKPAGLAAICRRLAVNYRYSHSGFPDLTLWHKHTGRIKFVEVKTDSDKPSMKQLQWMQYLRAHNIEAEFCYVGVHTTRQRSRNKTLKLPAGETARRPNKRPPKTTRLTKKVKKEPKEEPVNNEV